LRSGIAGRGRGLSGGKGDEGVGWKDLDGLGRHACVMMPWTVTIPNAVHDKWDRNSFKLYEGVCALLGH
jgi:hypothetical protein